MMSVSAACPEAVARPAAAAFEGGDALLKDVGGGVHDARVDVAELLEPEETGGVIGIVKDIRRGLVNRHRARLGGGIDLLAGMNGQGCKVMFLLGVVVALTLLLPVPFLKFWLSKTKTTRDRLTVGR